MEIWEVIAASSVVAALVTWFSNIWLSNRNYKQEYYKQLISKRLAAYQSVENVLKILGGHSITENQESIPRAFWNREFYIDFSAQVIHALTQSVWLSHDVTCILENINATLTKSSFDFKLEKAKDERPFHLAGLGVDATLQQYKADLFKQLKNDFNKLHDIEGFNKV